MSDTISIKVDFVGNLAKHALTLIDASGNKSAEDVANQLSTNQFKPCNDILFSNIKNPHSNYWYAFALKNDTVSYSDISINFYNSGLQLYLYSLDSNQHLSLLDSGSSHTPLIKRANELRCTSLKMPLRNYEAKILLIKAKPIDEDFFYSSPDITTTSDLMKWENGYMIKLGFFVGFFILALIVNVILGFVLNARIHFWQAGSILFLLLWQLKEYLIDVYFFPHTIFKWYTYIPESFFMMGVALFGLQVYSIFVSQKTKYPSFYKVKNILTYGILAIMLVLFSSSFSSNHFFTLFVWCRKLSMVVFGISILLIIINICYGIIKRDLLSNVYAISSMLLFSAFANFILFAFHLSPYDNYLYYEIGNITIGSCVEILLLTIIFALHQKRILNSNIQVEKDLANLKKEQQNKLIQGQEEDRKRIAEDLHDNLGGNLAAIKVSIQNLNLPNDKVNKLLALVDNTSALNRNIAHDLMPPHFENQNLEELLHNYFSNIKLSGFEFICNGFHPIFSKSTELIIYRIVLELFTNISKHSQATESSIQLIYFDNYLHVISEDNGVGIDTEKYNKGQGINNIKNRVTILNGEMDIQSQPNNTLISIKIPYNEKD